MIRPTFSHRLFHRGGRTLTVLLVALLAVGPLSAVMPRIVAVVQNSLPVNEEESGHEDHKANRLVRPLVGPPVPPRSIRSPARPAPPAESGLLPRHLRPSAPARGPDGPYLRC